MAIDRNITININDTSPLANTAYVDSGKENKVYNKAQVNELLEDVREGTLGSISPFQTLEQLNVLEDGNYYAEEAGTYAFGVTVPEGWQYRFNKTGTTWKVLTKVQIPMQDLTEIETGLEETKTKVDDFIRDFSVTTDLDFNEDSDNAIANSAVTPLANALDGFLDNNIINETVYLTNSFQSFSINGVSSTYKSDGINRLTELNTIIIYDDVNFESYHWLNVPTKINNTEVISKLDISAIRIGGLSSENPHQITLLGVKSNGDKVVLLSHINPFTDTIENHIIDLTLYTSFSLMIMNEKSTNNGKNGTIVKLYKASKSTTNVKEYIDSKDGIGANNRINIITEGAKGDGVTDDTNVINQAIIKLLNKGGGTLFFPAGFYKVSEIYIPNFDAWQSITLEGEFMPAPRFGTIVVPGVYDPDVTKPNGSVIVSNSTKSNKGIIFCNSGSSYQNFNLGILRMKNLTIRSYNNPQITAIHANEMAQLQLDNIVVDTGVYNVNASLPTYDVSGIITPKDSNCAYTVLNNVCVSGYKNGIQVNEHFNGDMLNIQSCVNGLLFNQAYHSALIKRVGLHRNTNHIKINGSHIFKIEAMNCEYAGANQTNVNNAWQATQYELLDPSNLGNGEIKYANVKGDVGKVNTFRINGGSNIIVKKIGSEIRLTGNGIPD